MMTRRDRPACDAERRQSDAGATSRNESTAGHVPPVEIPLDSVRVLTRLRAHRDGVDLLRSQEHVRIAGVDGARGRCGISAGLSHGEKSGAGCGRLTPVGGV